MIVTCPSCATRYLVDPAALGETGRMVRCARCTHAWTQAPPEDMPKRVDVIRPPDKATPIPPGSNLPAIPERGASASPAGWIALVLALVVVIGGVLAGRNQIVAAWGMPTASDADKNAKKQAIQDATRAAIVVPLRVMEVSLASMEVAQAMAEIGLGASVSDAGVAALAARSAVMGAHLNVKINAGGIEDKAWIDDILARAARMQDQAVAAERDVMQTVEARL